MNEVTFRRMPATGRANQARAEDLPAEWVAKLNDCGTYISVSVYRDDSIGDCTLLGVTSRARNLSLFVPHPRGNFTLAELTEDHDWRQTKCILEVIPPAFPGCTLRFKPRGETRWTMAGGNYVGTCDSRYSELYRYPCSVHDRIEG